MVREGEVNFHRILCSLGIHQWGSWKIKDIWARSSMILGRNCIGCGRGFVYGHDYNSMKAMQGLDCKMYADFKPEQIREYFADNKFYDEKSPEWIRK